MLPFEYADTRIALQSFVIRENFAAGTVVLDNEDLEIIIGRLRKNGIDAALQRLFFILIRDDDGNKRVRLRDIVAGDIVVVRAYCWRRVRL